MVMTALLSSESFAVAIPVGTAIMPYSIIMTMDAKESLEHFWPSMAVALGGFVLPFGLGFVVAWLFGGTPYQCLFVKAPLLTGEQFSGMVTMASVTTLRSPVFVKRLVEKACLPGERARFCGLWERQ